VGPYIQALAEGGVGPASPHQPSSGGGGGISQRAGVGNGNGGTFNSGTGGHPLSQGGAIGNRPPLVMSKPEDQEGVPLPPTTTVRGGRKGERPGVRGGVKERRKNDKDSVSRGILYGLPVHLYGTYVLISQNVSNNVKMALILFV
jgi:hypothetical protein